MSSYGSVGWKAAVADAAGWRMKFVIVSLELRPCGEVSRFAKFLLAQIRELDVCVDNFEADGATVPKWIMVNALVLSKVFCCIESLVTCFSRTWERLGT